MIRGRAALRLIVAVATVALVRAEGHAQQLVAQPFASGLSFPVAFLGDPTAANRHFVVEKHGFIQVLIDGVVQQTPFLNISDRISAGAEQGLLGMALDPDYANNRRFYVFFTRAGNPSAPECRSGTSTFNATACEAGDIVVARLRRSAGNPLIAEDPNSMMAFRWISTGLDYIEHSEFANHNGGSLMFGPDGYLYIGVGDGGAGYDPYNSGQSPDSLLGKMLRIDVDVPDANANRYQIPPDNPFVDDDPIDAFEEIWAFGLRNPWKFSFDDPDRGGSGALLIADVGQNRWEEINYEPAGLGGRNYGWRIREASHPEANAPPTDPAWGTLASLINPVFEYSHVAGEAIIQGASVTGGFVYRGSDLSARWRGRYFFGDFAAARIWSVQVAPGTGAFSGIEDHTAAFGAMNVSGFGVDQRGELYILRYAGVNQGIVYRLCEFTIEAGVVSFASTGGTGTARVVTQPGCPWRVSSGMPWVAVISNEQAVGSGMVTFRVAPTIVARTTQLTIAGQPVTIRQSGAPPFHGDIDGNMRGDLFWQHSDGRLAAWLMNGTTLLEGRPLGPGALADAQWRVAASADFDRDGSQDLVLQHQGDGRLALWRMSGTTLLSGAALSPEQVADTHWKIRGAGDFDQDGWPDLVWQHESNGDVAVWLMVGAQLREGRLFTPGTVSLDWHIVGVGDIDGDGRDDVVWQDVNRGFLAVWMMSGTTLINAVPLMPGQVADTDWKIRAVIDINGDRMLDFVWHNRLTGALFVWVMNGTAAVQGLGVTPPSVGDTNWQIVGPR